MRRFWIFTCVLLLAMLLLFFVMQALHLPFLEDNTDFMLGQEKWVAALCGVGLLIADVVAPVPSSIIMFANGILFGVVIGAFLSLLGGMGAAAIGHWIGRRGTRSATRWIGAEALRKSNAFFAKYGMMAIIVSRPIPLLAEAVSITAGLSGMSLPRLLLGSLIGLLPAVLLYAIAGAYTVDLNSSLYVLLAVVVLAGIVWLIGRNVLEKNEPESTISPNP